MPIKLLSVPPRSAAHVYEHPNLSSPDLTTLSSCFDLSLHLYSSLIRDPARLKWIRLWFGLKLALKSHFTLAVITTMEEQFSQNEPTFSISALNFTPLNSSFFCSVGSRDPLISGPCDWTWPSEDQMCRWRACLIVSTCKEKISIHAFSSVTLILRLFPLVTQKCVWHKQQQHKLILFHKCQKNLQDEAGVTERLQRKGSTGDTARTASTHGEKGYTWIVAFLDLTFRFDDDDDDDVSEWWENVKERRWRRWSSQIHLEPQGLKRRSTRNQGKYANIFESKIINVGIKLTKKLCKFV